MIFNKLITVEQIPDAYQFRFQILQELPGDRGLRSGFSVNMFAGTINCEFFFMEQMLNLQYHFDIFFSVRPLSRLRAPGIYFFKFSFPEP